jgi:hypothetical protein
MVTSPRVLSIPPDSGSIARVEFRDADRERTGEVVSYSVLIALGDGEPLSRTVEAAALRELRSALLRVVKSGSGVALFTVYEGDLHLWIGLTRIRVVEGIAGEEYGATEGDYVSTVLGFIDTLEADMGPLSERGINGALPSSYFSSAPDRAEFYP